MPKRLTIPQLDPGALAVDRGERQSFKVSEVYGSAASLFALEAFRQFRSDVVAVVPKGSDAENLELDLRSLKKGIRTVRLPAAQPYDRKNPEAKQNRSQREQALQALRQPAAGLLVLASLRALCDRTPKPGWTKQTTKILAAGAKLDRDQLRRDFYAAGFDPNPLVANPGEISFRGDIIDFYAFGASTPVRIELFDDEVESIREFDPETQRSTRQLDTVGLPTARRTILQSDAAFHALDHCRRPPVLLCLDPARIEFAAEELFEDHDARDADLKQVLGSLKKFRRIELHPEYHEDADGSLGARPIEGVASLEHLPRFAETLPAEFTALHLFSSTAAEGRRLTRLLRDHLPKSPRRGVHDQRGSLTRGFCIPAFGVWVANHHELLGRTRLKRAEATTSANTRPIQEALELSPGDTVVHMTHGVGLFRGMKEHKNDGGTEDYLILEFDGGTLLYVPASKIDLLSRFIGAGSHAPRLDKIGGKSWTRKKASVEAALQEIATDLLELQARRATREGLKFVEDEQLQFEFDSSFPYSETQDQLRCNEEIRHDMLQARAMDRLLCGDVGFGKTELAVRAAFRAACASKQVAVLAPTTLLVRQHAETFKNRMADYPLRVEALSRFTTTAKSTKILEDTAQGRIDILIGTHRLLSPKVRFKDLGLIIIDEEQRFGVRHKETLKMLRAEVDVLTLSATPIPRTMHMAMVGLRDISTLREPPRGRQPVETVVTYYQDDLVRRAIQTEMSREGQVFYLYNRVQEIEAVAARVQKLVPKAKLAVAHGQMPSRRLEKAAAMFQRGDLDVLVCTSIIESGIDIPRVNTLIVERAEILGLADLHQLRGRIGRSERKAHAYFLIPPKPLPAAALKRLRALQGLSHLGAGFDVAVRDLEIRGAGNLLGAEQSGHIEAVGYDLYCRLLAKVVARKKGKKPPPEVEEIDVNLGLPAFLPREYVHSSHQRMGLMRRLGEARSVLELRELAREMRDRFGRLPQTAENLLKVFELKTYCRQYAVSRIFYPGSGDVLLNVRGLRRFARAPLGDQETRFVEGSRVHLVPPPRVTTPEAILEHLLQRFSGQAAVPEDRTKSSSSTQRSPSSSPASPATAKRRSSARTRRS